MAPPSQIRFRFTVARPVPLGIQANEPGKSTRPGQVQSFRSAPELHPPTVTVATQSTAVAPGDIFPSPGNKLGQAGPLILDGRGSPVWFHPLAGRTQAFDFRQQGYDGKPVLSAPDRPLRGPDPDRPSGRPDPRAARPPRGTGKRAPR